MLVDDRAHVATNNIINNMYVYIKILRIIFGSVCTNTIIFTI